jgi:hypothetical protein
VPSVDTKHHPPEGLLRCNCGLYRLPRYRRVRPRGKPCCHRLQSADSGLSREPRSDGKLDLVAPVAKYLPEFVDLKVGVEQTDPATGKPSITQEPQKRPMTVQDLLRHTAGLVYGQYGDTLVHREYRAIAPPMTAPPTAI